MVYTQSKCSVNDFARIVDSLCRLIEHVGAFAVVYGIFLSFGELGPGNCLGLLASKSGPTAIRGQYYGTAAAIGKVGAFVGTWGMWDLFFSWNLG